MLQDVECDTGKVMLTGASKGAGMPVLQDEGCDTKWVCTSCGTASLLHFIG
jgi:hypothetical protein